VIMMIGCTYDRTSKPVSDEKTTQWFGRVELVRKKNWK
jgi:hypothetical protein